MVGKGGTYIWRSGRLLFIVREYSIEHIAGAVVWGRKHKYQTGLFAREREEVWGTQDGTEGSHIYIWRE